MQLITSCLQSPPSWMYRRNEKRSGTQTRSSPRHVPRILLVWGFQPQYVCLPQTFDQILGFHTSVQKSFWPWAFRNEHCPCETILNYTFTFLEQCRHLSGDATFLRMGMLFCCLWICCGFPLLRLIENSDHWSCDSLVLPSSCWKQTSSVPENNEIHRIHLWRKDCSKGFTTDLCDQNQTGYFFSRWLRLDQGQTIEGKLEADVVRRRSNKSSAE